MGTITGMPDFIVKRNDRPTIYLRAEDSDGNAVDLTSATAKFAMRYVGNRVTKVNAAAAVDPDQVNNKGRISYTFSSGDTDTAGLFEFEVQVIQGGLPKTYPSVGYLLLRIDEDIAS